MHLEWNLDKILVTVNAGIHRATHCLMPEPAEKPSFHSPTYCVNFPMVTQPSYYVYNNNYNTILQCHAFINRGNIMLWLSYHQKLTIDNMWLSMRKGACTIYCHWRNTSLNIAHLQTHIRTFVLERRILAMWTSLEAHSPCFKCTRLCASE